MFVSKREEQLHSLVLKEILSATILNETLAMAALRVNRFVFSYLIQI